MDNNGKVIWARHNEIQTVNIKAASGAQMCSPCILPSHVFTLTRTTHSPHYSLFTRRAHNAHLPSHSHSLTLALTLTLIRHTHTEGEVVDGERLQLATKELGNCEIYPQMLKHTPNGRFVVVCGDGEYIIYTALAWRNKSFGNALDFVWAGEGGEYAVRESSSKVKIFKNFKETKTFRPNFSAEGIFGGTSSVVFALDFVSFAFVFVCVRLCFACRIGSF